MLFRLRSFLFSRMLEAVGTQGGGRGCGLALPGPSVFTLSLPPAASHLPLASLHTSGLPRGDARPSGWCGQSHQTCALASPREGKARQEGGVVGPGVSPGPHSSFPWAHPTHMFLLKGICTHAIILWSKVSSSKWHNPGFLPNVALAPASTYKWLVWLGSKSSSAYYYSCVVFLEKQHNVTTSHTTN